MSSRGDRAAIPWFLLAAFLVTRLVAVYLADHPDEYGTPNTRIVGDVQIYEGWANQIIDEGRAPYSEVAIEYPPAVIPVALAPKVGPDDSYRLLFVLLMLAIDAAGLAGLIALARRRGSMLGPWLWVAGVVLVGPILYLRLDLIPAVATIWAFERISAGSPGAAGGWLGLGVAAKIYPGLLLPIVALSARRKLAVVAGAVVVVLAVAAPFVRSLEPLFSNVLGYHADRGLQIESTWGSSLLLAGHFGYDAAIEYTFGAFHVASALSPGLNNVADVLSLLALAAGVAFAIKAAPREDDSAGAEISFATLASILAVGTVFSPQFMVWLLALAAVVACSNGSALSVPAVALLPLCALTQLIYPFNYDALIFREDGELITQLLILARNAGVLAIGVASFAILWRGQPRGTPAIVSTIAASPKEGSDRSARAGGPERGLG
jgi:hypothetical protein